MDWLASVINYLDCAFFIWYRSRWVPKAISNHRNSIVKLNISIAPRIRFVEVEILGPRQLSIEARIKSGVN